MVAGVIMGRWEAVTPSMSLTITMPCTGDHHLHVETSIESYLDGSLFVVLNGQREHHEGEPVNSQQ